MIESTSDCLKSLLLKIPRVRLLVITGLSGAGRTLALKALGYVGFKAIDNLPLSLISRLLLPLTLHGGGDHAIEYRFS